MTVTQSYCRGVGQTILRSRFNLIEENSFHFYFLFFFSLIQKCYFFFHLVSCLQTSVWEMVRFCCCFHWLVYIFLEIGNKVKTGHFFYIIIYENGKWTQKYFLNQTDSYILKNCICEVNYPLRKMEILI